LNELEFRTTATFFLRDLFQQCSQSKIEIEPHWDIDHLCFRVETEDEYRKFQANFLEFSELLIESPVQGRLISTFELLNPIVFNDRVISLVELPAPKLGKKVKTGFEHIEVVCALSFEELRRKYSHLKIDDKGLNKSFNREFEIELDRASVKFHHSSLASVIRLEQNSKVFQTLMKSELLQSFKDCDPLIAGTFPLGLETESSDIDLLLNSCDLLDIEHRLKSSYQQRSNFRLDKYKVKENPTLICHFDFEGVPFEIFVQSIPTVRQDAQRHFVIEDRILKLGGALFKERVREQRRLGLKTEAAFVKALGFNDPDPFQFLLNFCDSTDKELAKLF